MKVKKASRTRVGDISLAKSPQIDEKFFSSKCLSDKIDDIWHEKYHPDEFRYLF